MTSKTTPSYTPYGQKNRTDWKGEACSLDLYMLLRFQKAAVRGNYETGNQAFSKRLRFLTTRGGAIPPAYSPGLESRGLQPRLVSSDCLAAKMSFLTLRDAGERRCSTPTIPVGLKRETMNGNCWSGWSTPAIPVGLKPLPAVPRTSAGWSTPDRKSTRLNSSH